MAYRGWENDQDVADDGEDPNTCDDIAEQLIRGETGRGLQVMAVSVYSKTYLR